MLTGCNQPQLTAEILEQKTLKNIPSASGIVKISDGIYVIGDNTPWIYKISSKELELTEKFRIFETTTDAIIPKMSKPDFEAITEIQWEQTKELFIFGSGSKSPQRDVLKGVTFGKETTVNTYNLSEFYELIKSSTSIEENKLNIEAAAANETHLFLFNRGENLVLQYEISAFIDYIKHKGECPKPISYSIHLPQLNGIDAGFSGACFVPDEEELVFTASLEDTDNPIDDGDVLGSYVGIIKLKNLKDNYQPDCVLISSDNQPLKIKVESVEVMNHDASGKEILIVTDSDGGTSEILRILLKWK